MIPAIKISKLSKTFRGKRGARVEALKQLDLIVKPGEVFGYLGPNGAGKSTTIKILTGQIRQSGGDSHLFDVPSRDPNSRRNVGYLPENPSLYEYLTAREYLHYAGSVYRMDRALLMTKCDEVLEKLGLEHASNRRIRGYSKGMVQRLGLAQTLLHDPDLYILDEPMSGLDPVGRALIKDIIIDLKKRGKTVFFSTHIISDVEAVCDRVAILAKGELRAENFVSDLFEKSTEGYRISLDKVPQVSLDEFLAADVDQDLKMYYVSSNDLNRFMRLVDDSGCTVRSIDPIRKNLESFFLETIS